MPKNVPVTSPCRVQADYPEQVSCLTARYIPGLDLGVLMCQDPVGGVASHDSCMLRYLTHAV